MHDKICKSRMWDKWQIIVQAAFVIQLFSPLGKDKHAVCCSRSFILLNTKHWVNMWVYFSQIALTGSWKSPYRAGGKKAFCPSQEPSQRLCILPETSSDSHCCTLIQSHAVSLLEIAFSSQLPGWCEPRWAPQHGWQRDAGSSPAHSLACCLPAGSSWLLDSEGRFWHISGKSSMALLIEHGCLICRLYSSDSWELSVLMLHSLSLFL